MTIDRRKSCLWLAAGLATVSTLTGCASDKPKPAALEDLVPSRLASTLLWERHVASISFPVLPVLHQGKLAVPDDDGSVSVFDVATGKGLWRGETRRKPSAGVGFDGQRAAMVTRDNELVVLDGTREIWRQRLESRVVTAPLVAGERVFVLAVDRTVRAYDAVDGRYLWLLKRPGDALTLVQPGVLTAYRNTLIVGQGARWVGVDPLTGAVRWETILSSPRGTNEVERLADLVGPAARLGEIFCARSFQNAVGCLDAERGVTVSSFLTAGTQPVDMDADLVYGADASDRITARRRKGGEIAWSSERLLHRDLSGPVALTAGVVFGDQQGFLHLLDRESGRTLLRAVTDGSRVVSLTSLGGQRVLAVTQRGGLYAFQIQ